MKYDRQHVTATAARARREVLDDVTAGRVPADVPDFATLHDYVDANEYGGLCDGPLEWTPDGTLSDATIAFGNAVQADVDAWIRSGGLRLAAATTPRTEVPR